MSLSKIIEAKVKKAGKPEVTVEKKKTENTTPKKGKKKK